MTNKIVADLPQGGNCKYEIKSKGTKVTVFLSVPTALGEVIGFKQVTLSGDQELINRKNKWFIKSEHLFTWAEIEKVGVYNMYYKLMEEARKSKRHLVEYHKDSILDIIWSKMQR